MPRKKLIYTSEFPYHIVARCNNKDWFYLNLDETWDLFKNELNIVSIKFGFKVHAFVLMSNHYHLIASTNNKYNLGYVMNMLQKRITDKVNLKSKRTNHVFGGPYKGSLITENYYYINVLKYVFRNPVSANIVKKVGNYKFSTIDNYLSGNANDYIITSSHIFDQQGRRYVDDFDKWFNFAFSNEDYELMKKGVKKTNFKICGAKIGNQNRVF